MLEQWTTTTDTRMAAAFGTIGVPVRLRTTIIERTATRSTRFYIALQSVDGDYKTGAIRSAFESGKLSKTDPAHPFLTILRAFENRRLFLDFQNKGRCCTLVQVPGTEIWQYVPSSTGLPGLDGHKEIIKTEDIKMLAALGIMGIPCVKLEGGGHNHQYFLPRYGPVRADGIPPVDGLRLLESWRKDKEIIPWSHPFAQAARGLYNRERFLDAINRDTELLILQKPRSQRAAVLDINSTPAAFDAVKEHFDR
jgi:hypothetical protein